MSNLDEIETHLLLEGVLSWTSRQFAEWHDKELKKARIEVAEKYTGFMARHWECPQGINITGMTKQYVDCVKLLEFSNEIIKDNEV